MFHGELLKQANNSVLTSVLHGIHPQDAHYAEARQCLASARSRQTSAPWRPCTPIAAISSWDPDAVIILGNFTSTEPVCPRAQLGYMIESQVASSTPGDAVDWYQQGGGGGGRGA